jgi:hypothetical protein
MKRGFEVIIERDGTLGSWMALNVWWPLASATKWKWLQNFALNRIVRRKRRAPKLR